MTAPPAYLQNGQPVSEEAFYAVACDPRRSVAVEACAGAGKTWMLVSRIVRALLEGAQPHEILAITFTKRAASEMRERLYKWLVAFSKADQDQLFKELRMRGIKIEKGSKPALDMSFQLSKLYQTVLQSGRQVQVRTFHSWFASLVRNAPLAVLQQLGLPLNFELLEDDAPAKALVWRRFYATLASDAQHKADFEAVVFDYGRSQAQKALAGALDKRVEFALADAQGVVDASVQPFTDFYPEFDGLSSPAEALQSAAARALWLQRAKVLGSESNKTPQKAANSIVEAFELTDLNARLDGLRKAFFVADEDRLTQHLKKFPAALEAEPELQRLCAARHQHNAWAYQQRLARLTRVLVAEFAALKREHGWVDMNDVEHAARVLLSDSVLSGWVQQRLDARINHLLIDEFQDTNPLQWQSLMAWLGSYAGSGGGAQPPSVFLVGDPKQSIYRFRRAEPQVFRAAKRFMREGLGGDVLSCDHTRRNAREVLACVNATLGAAREHDHYEDFRDHTTNSDEAGQVGKLPPITRESNDATADASNLETNASVWRDSLTTPRETLEETLRMKEARQAANWVAAQLAAGVPTHEIMVLSRKRAGLLPMQDALRALQIPAQIGEKTDLIECCEVQDLVALLDVLVSPQHDLSLARALKSPLFGASDDELIALAMLRRQVNEPWFDLLQKQELTTQYQKEVSAILLRWKAWLDQLPPHDALQAIYADGDVLARFAMAAPAPEREAVLANLQALLTLSLQMDGGRYATPYAFVRALKAGGVVAPATVNPQAVRLLTIHGAKGLEAHTVLLLDTDTPARNAETMGVLVNWPGDAPVPTQFVFLASESKPPASAVAMLEVERAERAREELNALYVALTRAEHTLAISSIEPYRSADHSWWQRLAGFIPDVALPPITPHLAAPLNGVSSSDVFYILKVPEIQYPIEFIATNSIANNVPQNQTLSDDDASALIGKAMHRLLEWGDVSVQSASAAAREFLLTPAQSEQAWQMAQRILNGAGAWAWDAATVGWQGNEVTLLHQGQTLRLDRLVQRQDTGDWWVLDYKSSSTPQHDSSLVAQLLTYRTAVQAIYPETEVHAAFLTGQGECITLA